mgnify:CR=1 FL=1
MCLMALTKAATPPDGPITYAANFKSCKACIDSGRNLCLAGGAAADEVELDIGYCCPTTGVTL